MSTRTTPINTRRSMEVLQVDVLTEDNKIFEFSVAPGGCVSDQMHEKGYSFDQYIEVYRGISRINC
jgi:hypothetical protein